MRKKGLMELIALGIIAGAVTIFGTAKAIKGEEAKTVFVENQEILTEKSENLSNGDEDKKDKKLNLDENAVDAAKVEQMLKGTYEDDGEKIVFLTFDDGPSTSVTPKILDTLKEYNVKATFFQLGENIEKNEESKKIVKRIYDEGHALGNHTYTHSLETLYPNNQLDIETYMKEVESTDTSMKEIIGQDFNTRILRMPGGYMSREYYNDPNLGAFNERLKKENWHSIDWNAMNGDADGTEKSAEELLTEVKNTAGEQNKIVILMHDTYGKEETADALPNIIEYLKEQGYKFKTIK
ncbi:MAG: polysaccharide deacetylase [Clostridium argentinense]|nr:polysaccharide deacetylase [Clostridium argentinense]